MKQLLFIIFALSYLCSNSQIKYSKDAPFITITIDADKQYIAGDIILGNNVTLKAGVTLTLNSKGGFRILDNVVCEGNAKLILKNI